MTPFLYQVAKIYAKKEKNNISDICFIFPLKRSADFFRFYLKSLIPDDNIHLNTITIGEFVKKLNPQKKEIASRTEQLFILFNEYNSLRKDNELEFENFSFWGNMILDDFNDVDKYLVDAAQLFENLKRYKDINSNYLTEEQKEIIHRYWKIEKPLFNSENFWKHIRKDGEKKLSDKFLLLWSALSQLYENFHQELDKRNKTTYGMLYRNAALRMKNPDDRLNERLKYTRYVFVGFDILSTSESLIFGKLKDWDKADFYWDLNSPFFEESFNDTIKHIKRNRELYPSKFELDSIIRENKIGINISGIPGNIAQTDYAGATLKKWIEKNVVKSPSNAIDTAVVLPDESLFTPLLYSIPEDFYHINLTIGLSMRDNPISAIFRSLVILHQRSRLKGNDISFFHEDVKDLLSFPLIKNISIEESGSLENGINDKRLFQIPYVFIEKTAPSLAVLLKPVKTMESLSQVNDYLLDVISLIKKSLPIGDSMSHSYLKSYQERLTDVYNISQQNHISMKPVTFMKMIERAIINEKIHFSGDPVEGLQIMGFDDTPNMSFENLIILSMNEGVIPRKNYKLSFIPDLLRKSFCLPSVYENEGLIAYYFYRLISCASNIELVYDARKGGLKSGEFSRYITQLLYMAPPGIKITHKLMSYDILTQTLPVIEIEKTSEIMQKLMRFTSTDPQQKKSFSASSLNMYINCPLEFYLRYVENIYTTEDMQDYIDASQFGLILHNVAQDFYNNLKGSTITSETIRKFLEPNNVHIDKLITKYINTIYNNITDDPYKKLTGEALITAELIKEMFSHMLQRELRFTPFEFKEAEYKIDERYKVNKNLTVNIVQFIDRIDELISPDGGRLLRIVDYKTGSDLLKAPAIDELFKHTDKSYKAIMQLMFYCLMYANKSKSTVPIQPIIYKMLEMGKNDIANLSIAGSDILDFNEYKDEYEAELNKLIEEIFNPDIPFHASENIESCRFCDFKSICKREA